MKQGRSTPKQVGKTSLTTWDVPPLAHVREGSPMEKIQRLHLFVKDWFRVKETIRDRR